MIQIYDPGNTKYDFNGDVTLDPYSCECIMILNDAWSLELEAPIDKEGKFKHIVKEAVISAPTPVSDRQLFRIYETEKTDSSITAIALPIFYDSKDDHVLLDVRPTGKNGQQALDIICAGSKYSGESNITKATTAYYIRKNLMEAINGDLDQSFISRWGGEILYDNYKVIINERVGGDYGARAEFGYNLEGIKEHVDMSNVVTRIIPVAYNGYTLDGNTPWVDSPNIKKYQKVYTRTMEFSDIKLKEDSTKLKEDSTEDDENACNTLEELRRRLIEECQKQYAAGVDLPEVTYEVDMVSLEGTEEYKDYENLENVGLGDDVKCKHHILEIETTARVTELTYDCINRRNRKIKLGKFSKTAFGSQFDTEHKINSIIAPDGSVMAEKVQGILNGIYTQLKLQSTVAQKVKGRAFTVEDLDPDSDLFGCMTWGTQGLQLAVRRTADGRDWDWTTAITAQGIVANAIIAGILSDKTGRNFWNLDTGEFRLSSDAFKLDGKPLVTEEYVDKMNGNLLKGSSLEAGRNFWNLDTGEFRLSSDAFKLDGKPLVTEEYVDKMNGNLLKGSSLEVEDIKTYWDVAGKIEHDIEDPSGGVYAIRLTGTVSDNFVSAKYSNNNPINTAGWYEVRVWLKAEKDMSSGGVYAIRLTGTVSDNFVSAKYSNNNPINTAGWYEVRVWLKAEKDMSVTISANRVAYKCAVTTKWQQFRIMLPVSAPNTQGFQNFTIGGWGSIPKDAVVYIYRPEISYSYSPDDMLDILTENGKRKGIYSKNGMLYIDGTYIRSGKVSGEYIDARNLTVTNTAGQKTLAVDNTGNVDMNVRSLSILGSAIASEAYADRQSGNLLKGGNLRVSTPKMECST